jgi:Phospholipid N-methyltransferase
VPNNAVRRAEEVLLFARNFVRHPRMLGSIIPSSRFLVKGLLEPVDWNRARVVVEYGPGIGNITAEILRRMRPDATLVAIETNEDFVRFLRSTFRDPRLHVAHDSAANTDQILRQLGIEKADYVISGVPFSTMPRDVRERILRTTRSVLAPDGRFLLYQFSSRVLPDLKRFFRTVERGFEPLNILPAQLFFCGAGGENAQATH